jgi:hypothetical protein
VLDAIEFWQARQGCSVAGQPVGDELLERRTRLAEQTTEEMFSGVCRQTYLRLARVTKPVRHLMNLRGGGHP